FPPRPRLPLVITHPAREASAVEPNPNGALTVLQNAACRIRGETLFDGDRLPAPARSPVQARFGWYKKPSVTVHIEGREIHGARQSAVFTGKESAAFGPHHQPFCAANPQISRAVGQDRTPSVW